MGPRKEEIPGSGRQPRRRFWYYTWLPQPSVLFMAEWTHFCAASSGAVHETMIYHEYHQT